MNRMQSQPIQEEKVDKSHKTDLFYDDINQLFRELNYAFITYMNFGWSEDYDKFSQLMDEFIGLLCAKLMANRSYQGAGDVLFAGVLFQMDRRMSEDLAKPLNVSVEGTSLTLSVNPVLFFMYYQGPKQMLAGIRQICYHIIFNHLTDYDWAFLNEEDGKMMSVAMDTEVNQYIDNLPDHAASLDSMKQLLSKNSLNEKQGSLYYYQELKAARDDPKHHSHDRVWSTFEKMKGSGDMNDTYSQLSKNFDPEKARELRIESAEQLNDEMKKNHSMQPVIPQSKNNDLHRKIINGIVRKAYENMDEEMRQHLSGNIKEKVQVLFKQRSLNWKDIIMRGLGQAPIPYRYSKNRGNRRQPYRIDLPGRTLDTAAQLVAFIDTSASQNAEALAYSLAELANINKTLGTDIWVVQVDTQVVGVKKLDQSNVDQFQFEGRGGTSFAPAFEWLHENGFNDRNSVSVYFTDGYGDDGFERYGYQNMYWVLTTADPKEPSPLSTDSGGKLLYLRQDEKYNHRIIKQKRHS
ncbi:VWA-like domain-containing protein [Aerococcus urinae]|uniref:vWA domain-containing protein n=1 Tax=Aerococcus urinae TaxID=1376 RepID=UPI0018E1857F|nr:VWA-like domain-containing protein [Aerococcus urinae]